MVERKTKAILRKLPAVHVLINSDEGQKLIDEYGYSNFMEACNYVLDSFRKQIIEQEKTDFSEVDIFDAIKSLIIRRTSTRLKRVVNGTGIILHTNLGRSVLGKSVVEAVIKTAGTYTNLEYDLDSGKRGSRYDHVREILVSLTGAEDALVVNNNAAAVLLVVNTFASGKEAIVSRGELVEIGGSFRIPEVLKLGNVSLVEVGTTNKTWLKDYKMALNENTALFMKVHTSNYKIVGFTQSVAREELVGLAKEHGFLFIEDLGSGALLQIDAFGASGEPVVSEVISKGVDIVTFSGDKLLGGPQAGIIVGKKYYIDKIKKNQLTRALRVDKLTLAALEATLKAYLKPENIKDNIPIYNMLFCSEEELKDKAYYIYEGLLPEKDKIDFSVVPTKAQMGGGSLPGQIFPSWGLVIFFKDIAVSKAEERLRGLETPIIGYIEKDKFVLDMRTLLDGDEDIIIQGLKNIIN